MAETVLLRVELDGEQTQRGLANLEEQIAKLSRERKDLQKELRGLIQQEEELNDQRKELGEVTQDLARADITVNEASVTLSGLLANLTEEGKQGTIQFNAFQNALQGLENTDNVQTAVDELRIAYDLLDKEIQGVRNGTEDTRGIEATSEALSINKTTTTEARREYRLLGRELRAVEGTLEEKRTRLVRLNNEYVKFASTTDRTEKELEQFQNQIRELNEEIKAQEKLLGDNRRNVGNYRDSFVDAFNQILPGVRNFNLLLTAGVPLIGIAIQALGEGLSQALEFSRQLADVRRQIGLVTDAQGRELDELTGLAAGITQTFENVDINRLVEQTNQLEEQFGIGLRDSIDLVGQSLTNLSDIQQDEFLDIVREYPSAFRDAGVEADAFLAIAQQQVQSGLFSDRGVDAIKEASLEIRELRQPVRDALQGIGVDTEALQQRLQEGTTTVFEEIQGISERLNDLPPESDAAQTAVREIFKTPGEDAQNFILSLADINTNFEDLQANSTETAQRQQRLLAANQELSVAFSRLTSGGSEFFKEVQIGATEFLAEGLTSIIDGFVNLRDRFVELYNNSLLFRRVLQAVGAAGRSAFTLILAPLRSVAAGVEALFSALGEALEGNFIAAGRRLVQGIGDTLTVYRDAGVQVFENFRDGFNDEKIDLGESFNEQSIEVEARAAGKKTGETVVQATKEEIEARAKEIREAAIEALNLEAQEIEIDLLTNQNFEEEFEKRRRLIELEREIALQAEELSASERLAIQRRFIQQTQDLQAEQQAQSLQARKDLIEAELTAEREGSERYFDLLRSNLEVERQIELSNTRTTAEEKLRIQAEYLADLAKLQKDQSLRLFTELQALQESDINLQAERGFITEVERLEQINELRRSQAEFTLEQFRQENQGRTDAILQQQELENQLSIQQLEREKEIVEARKQEQESFVNAEAELNELRVKAVGNIGDVIVNLTEEESGARKVGIALQKAAAIGEIAVNLQRQLSLIDVAIAAQAALGPIGALTGGLFLGRKILAVTEAAARTASVFSVQLEDGGQLATAIYEQTGINPLHLADGGMLIGPSHENGGIPAYVKGFGPIEMEGYEYVVNKAATLNNLEAIETINQFGANQEFQVIPKLEFGGHLTLPKLQTGGLVTFTSQFTGTDNTSQLTRSVNGDSLINLVRNIPPNVVVLEELTAALDQYVESVNFSD